MAHMHDADERRRFTPAAVRGFFGVVTALGFSKDEQHELLSASVSTAELEAWRAGMLPAMLTVDQLTRVSLLLGIFEGLERLFHHSPSEAGAWLRHHRGVPPFDARAPLDVMLRDGVAGLTATRRYIESAAGGPPRRAPS